MGVLKFAEKLQTYLILCHTRQDCKQNVAAAKGSGVPLDKCAGDMGVLKFAEKLQKQPFAVNEILLVIIQIDVIAGLYPVFQCGKRLFRKILPQNWRPAQCRNRFFIIPFAAAASSPSRSRKI